MLFTVLRLVHITTGVFWAGTVFFVVSFLLPSVADMGPDGGKVMTALTKRGLPTKLPIVAILAVLSGLWMYYLEGAGGSGWYRSRFATTLGVGGASAIIAVLFGIIVAGPTVKKLGMLGPEIASMPAGPDKDAKMAEMNRLRAKNIMGLRFVAMLLGITVIAMAVARYV